MEWNRMSLFVVINVLQIVNYDIWRFTSALWIQPDEYEYSVQMKAEAILAVELESSTSASVLGND